MMVRRVAKASLDHKFILLEGIEVPVGKEAVPDDSLIVSSDPDEDLSNAFSLNFISLRT